MSTVSVTGAILAGGPKSLLGGTLKALLPLQEEAVIVRQVREMRKLCKEVIVVTDTPKPFFDVLDSSVRIITDFFPGRGPLGGMHSALRLARNPLVWIVGSDMPFVSAEEARRLMTGLSDGVQAVIPIVGERPVPLHGLYDSRCSESVAALLTAGGESMESLLGRVPWLGVPAESDAGENASGFSFEIRCESDYERARSLLHIARSTG